MDAPKNITLCADGKYRWTYEFSMLKNPMILLTIFKIFFFIDVGLFVFLNLLDLFGGRLYRYRKDRSHLLRTYALQRSYL